jgi:hypothetical protein
MQDIPFPSAKGLGDNNAGSEIIKNINRVETFINIAMHIFTDQEIIIPLKKDFEQGGMVQLRKIRC